MKLEKEEINKTIAEYMGLTFKKLGHPFGREGQGEKMMNIESCSGIGYWKLNYTDSLDACIPVVEKLYKENSVIDDISLMLVRHAKGIIWDANAFVNYQDEEKHFDCIDKSPSLALATALAKAILELKND